MIFSEARMGIARFLGQKPSSIKARGLGKGGFLSFQPHPPPPHHLLLFGPSALTQGPTGAAGWVWADVLFDIVVGKS